MIAFLTSTTSLDILFKLTLAFILSAVIGVERELIHKPAGIKTHTLICIAATLTMSVGIYMYNNFSNMDPSRLPAQILAGIGFVGAGTIMREGFSVKGITTAASLLTITCIGLAVGAGFYEAAIYSTIFIFLILSLTLPLQNFIHAKRKHVLFNIESTAPDGTLGKIEEVFLKNNTEILSIQKLANKEPNHYTLKIFAKCNNASSKEILLNEICKIENIHEVYTSKRFSRQEDND